MALEAERGGWPPCEADRDGLLFAGFHIQQKKRLIHFKGRPDDPPRITRPTVWLSSLSLAAIRSGGPASTYARTDDTVGYGTVIGTLGALRIALPGIEKKHGLKYDMKNFRDATSTLLALDQGELKRKYSHLPDAVIAMQERQFLNYNYRTDVADLKAMAKELRELGWVKEDYSDRVDKYVDFTFLANATGQSPAQLSTW